MLTPSVVLTILTYRRVRNHPISLIRVCSAPLSLTTESAETSKGKRHVFIDSIRVSTVNPGYFMYNFKVLSMLFNSCIEEAWLPNIRNSSQEPKQSFLPLPGARSRKPCFWVGPWDRGTVSSFQENSNLRSIHHRTHLSPYPRQTQNVRHLYVSVPILIYIVYLLFMYIW